MHGLKAVRTEEMRVVSCTILVRDGSAPRKYSAATLCDSMSPRTIFAELQANAFAVLQSGSDAVSAILVA